MVKGFSVKISSRVVVSSFFFIPRFMAFSLAFIAMLSNTNYVCQVLFNKEKNGDKGCHR